MEDLMKLDLGGWVSASEDYCEGFTVGGGHILLKYSANWPVYVQGLSISDSLSQLKYQGLEKPILLWCSS